MVRYLVGTMVAISRGNYTMKEFKELLNNPKHDAQIYRAPANGLVLDHVSYE
jgi:tRNA U38,U39,U40 pseudouridine synthase TruA